MKPGIHGLPRRSAVIARRRRRLHLAVAVLGLGLIGFVAGVGYELWPHRADVVATVASAFSPRAPQVEPVAAEEPARPVFRHSVVPGGAYSQQEVADAVGRDGVVAAHYQSIDVERVRPTTVTVPRAVYVSYRTGNQVYWTRQPVRLAPGETLLTDGTSEIRARCGNLVSDHARQPVAADEPPAARLDETETGDSSIAGARSDPSGLTHVPFMQAWSGSYAGGTRPSGADPAPGLLASNSHVWPTGGGFWSPNGAGSHASGAGSHVTVLGSGPRGSNGGVKDEVPFLPPGGGLGDNGTTTGGTPTTTGGTTGLTTGITVEDTTGHASGDGEVPSVPEPVTLLLLGLGAGGVVARAWRARR